MLDQDTLHFLNRLWITLHRMCRVHNLFRCDAVDMRARIFYYSVSSICRRATAFNPNNGMGDTPSAMGIADKPSMKRLLGFMLSMLVGRPLIWTEENPFPCSVKSVDT